MNNIYQTLNALRIGINDAPDEFMQCEQEVVEAMSRLTHRLDLMSQQMNSFFESPKEEI